MKQLQAQIVIATPQLQFTQACANESFNSYTVDFVFNPESALEEGNQFIIEMSDETGDFTNATVLYTSNPGTITTSPASIDFSLPETTAGEAYRLKVRSTQPIASSTPSDSFSAYYKIHDTPFSINNLDDTASFCPGGTYLLTIDQPGNGSNDSPLNYPSLTFNWYREINPTTSEFITQSPTLSVSQEGVYFVETNYGTCTSNSFSNRVTITEATSDEEVFATIQSSEGTLFCGADGPTVLNTVPGDSYQWYFEGAPISGATNLEYETNQSGNYSVVVTFGSCQATGTISIDAGDFFSSLDVPEVSMIEEGDSLWVTVSTNAINPEFEWFFNEEVIPNASQDNLEVYEFGNYRVRILQTEVCANSDELTFVVEELVNIFPEVEKIPNLISPNGDGINDTWVIPTQYVSGTNTEITIYSSYGKKVFSTQDYTNNWPENHIYNSSVNEVFYYVIIPTEGSPKKGSITLIK